jgi:outer membrane lipoprotein carrier protein
MLRARDLPLWAALALAAAAVAVASAASAPATTALDRYLSGLESLNTAFTQTVTDSHGAKGDAGSGQLLVQRPGKFRWDYAPQAGASKPASGAEGAAPARGQVLVADGNNLWFYDRELAQVTVKPLEAALSSTPIILLSGSSAQLHESFEISGEGAHDGFDWVSVKPRSAEADFSHAELGFTGDQLARMVVHDRLGQTVELDFSHSVRNGRIDAKALQFQPPAGVDVIGTPQG